VMGPKKQRCHTLLANITQSGLHHFILGGYLLICLLTAAAALMQGTDRSIIFLMTFVVGGFLLFGFQRCGQSLHKQDLTDMRTREMDRFMFPSKRTSVGPSDESHRYLANLIAFWPAVYAIWGYTAAFLTLAPMILMAPANQVITNTTDPDVFAEYIGAPGLMSEGKKTVINLKNRKYTSNPPVACGS